MVSHTAGWGARARGVNDQEEEGGLQPFHSHMEMEGKDDGRSPILKKAWRREGRGDMMNSRTEVEKSGFLTIISTRLTSTRGAALIWLFVLCLCK